MIEFVPDGGGPVERPGNLITSPSAATALGNVVVGLPSSVVVTAQNTGTGSLILDAIAAPGAEWALSGLPSLPLTLHPAESTTFTLTLSPVSLGAKATTLTLTWEDTFGAEPDVTVPFSGFGISAGTHVGAWQAGALAYPTIQVNLTNNLVANIKNVGSGAFQVTALAFTTGTQFNIVGAPALPFTLNPGDVQPITVQFAPLVVGNLSDTLTATTDTAGNLALGLQGICVLIVPVAVCVNNDRRVIISGYDASGLQAMPAPLILSADSYDSDQLGAIVFNGALWEGLGVEKTLFRLGFYYENLGVANLSGTVSCFRPQQGVDALDLKPFIITLGTALADGTTRYAEADITATGEILSLTLGRAASSGPISICAIVPYFEPRGEKVRNS